MDDKKASKKFVIMNGLTIEETQKNYDKIISKLAKEVVIQKDSS
jgi:hypothetical protein